MADINPPNTLSSIESELKFRNELATSMSTIATLCTALPSTLMIAKCLFAMSAAIRAGFEHEIWDNIEETIKYQRMLLVEEMSGPETSTRK